MMKDISPYLLLSALLTGLAYCLTQDWENVVGRLAGKIAFVGMLYIGILWKLKSVILQEAVGFFRKKHQGV